MVGSSCSRSVDTIEQGERGAEGMRHIGRKDGIALFRVFFGKSFVHVHLSAWPSTYNISLLLLTLIQTAVQTNIMLSDMMQKQLCSHIVAQRTMEI